MDWIHCNVCYTQPGDLPKRQFNLTNCGHILCAFCQTSGEQIECKVCKSKCNTIKIAVEMPTDVQMFFEDPDVIMTKLVKVLEFQRSHRIRLNESRKIATIKYQKAKAEIMRLYQEIVVLKSKIGWYVQQFESRRSEIPPPTTGPSLLPQYSHNSQAYRTRSINDYFYEQQPLRTPTLSLGNHFSGYRYNKQGTTPETPSDRSNSPASVLSANMTPPSQIIIPQSQPYHHNQPRSQYRSGMTPPMSNLDLLSFTPQRFRRFSTIEIENPFKKN